MLPQVQSESPLNPEQKTRLYELERTVERNLSSFLEAGRALLAIRDERLYRTYGTWGAILPPTLRHHAKSRPGVGPLGRDRGKSLTGPGQSGQWDAPLPADLSQQALRPLNGLEPALACACWRLASHIGKPTGHTLGQIVRVVKGAIQQGQGNGSRQPKPKQPQKQIFLPSLYRLAAHDGFSAQIITLHITEPEVAKRCSTNCRVLINRCESILREPLPKSREPGLLPLTGKSREHKSPRKRLRKFSMLRGARRFN
jgi:hypothetical protein